MPSDILQQQDMRQQYQQQQRDQFAATLLRLALDPKHTLTYTSTLPFTRDQLRHALHRLADFTMFALDCPGRQHADLRRVLRDNDFDDKPNIPTDSADGGASAAALISGLGSNSGSGEYPKAREVRAKWLEFSASRWQGEASCEMGDNVLRMLVLVVWEDLRRVREWGDSRRMGEEIRVGMMI